MYITLFQKEVFPTSWSVSNEFCRFMNRGMNVRLRPTLSHRQTHWHTHTQTHTHTSKFSDVTWCAVKIHWNWVYMLVLLVLIQHSVSVMCVCLCPKNVCKNVSVYIERFLVRVCNPTDININILSSPCNNRATFPTHSSATTEKLVAFNQQDFQRTNVYSKASTLIINLIQPSPNNPKLPPKFQHQDNNHVQIPNIHRYKHIPLLSEHILQPHVSTLRPLLGNLEWKHIHDLHLCPLARLSHYRV